MGNALILLVEDNPDDEALIRRVMTKNGIQVELVVARDGEEALEYLFATGRYATGEKTQLPTFILLDLKLPKLNGLEVMRRIRDNDRTSLLPVVIFSSSNEEREIVNCYRQGANSYVRKSVDFARFNDAVRFLCHYWLDINEAPSLAAAK
jgi:CheY-like chemotaxis protein